MRASSNDQAQDPFTPSEIVLLRAEDLIMSQAGRRFRGPTPLFHGQESLDFVPSGGKFRLAEDRTELPSEAWALAMLAAAFLAAEREEWLGLEIHETSKWAGLSKRDALVAIHRGQVPDDRRWPDPNLEEQLARRAGREVRDIVADWLAKDVIHPFEEALSMGRENLVCRGRINEEQVKHLGFFSGSRYTVPPETDALLPAEDDVLTLVEDCLEERPGIWSALNDAVRGGIWSREDRSD
jgi:hypothetical protein